ncbi:hypothetical protein [Psychrobacter fozii]|uniref:Uncharacterized protein n=1 Tax=Psychrobacter fozii TaxID=198480 RepID=A0A2V4UQF7_9GAMM|nr:hypothetical protein [Psychrobacter fozii]PYE38786.1 hypothetical protein DFP82_106191 [Psychrobacter fozii]
MDKYIIRPQEIYLLERYSSPAYFKEMRDAFAHMLEAAEQALELFMGDLPSDYRSRPINRQPDIVWGERVLPSLRSTLDSLNVGYQELLKGDLAAIRYGGNVESDFRAINMDYDIDWMPEQQQLDYDKWERQASLRAFNMKITSYFGWCLYGLIENYSIESRGPLNPPESWPIYCLNLQYTVKTDEVVPVAGVYIPNRADASAQVLLDGMLANEAHVGYDPDTTHAVDDAPVTWILVERIANSGGGSSAVSEYSSCEADNPCPQTGCWWSPASQELQHFEAGNIMPDMTIDMWQTIWYFNETNPMDIQPTTNYMQKKRVKRLKGYQLFNVDPSLNNYVKYAFLTIAIVDVSIFLFVEQTCGAVIHRQLLHAIYMQILCLFMFADSKWMIALARVVNRQLATMKVAAFFIMLGSFYLFFLATKGVAFQNALKWCGSLAQ